MVKKCLCGCGKEVSNRWNYRLNKLTEYVIGHNNKGKPSTSKTKFKKGEEHRHYGKTYEELYGKEKAEEIIRKKVKTRKKNGWYKNPEAVSSRMKNNKIWDNPNSKRTQFKKGVSPHNKGKRKENYEPLRKFSKSRKELWKNKEFREKTLKSVFEGLHLKPNNPEKVIINLIQQNNLNFIYVGDGKKLIDGFCPDFVHKERKLIIEHFGDYWHNRDDWKERDGRRINCFGNRGYKTLIIWEHELKNPNQVVNKIKGFVR